MGINASTIQKLYIAYFNRPADVAGLNYWEGQLDANRISLGALAQSFSEQVEYRNIYGGKSSSDVISAIYKNLFARAADAEGLAYWAGQIDGGKVNFGTAALAILNGASPGSQDDKTIQNKLSFATDFTNSLNTDAKIASYSSASGFDSMRIALASVTADSTPGQLTLNKAIVIKEASGGINAAEKAAGMDVLIDLAGIQVQAGYQLELMNGNSSFARPILYTLNTTDAINQKVSIRIPAGTDWGTDGSKLLGVRIVDLKGNTGKIGGLLSVQLDTIPPLAPNSLSMEVSYAQSSTSSSNYEVVAKALHIDLPGALEAGSKLSLQLGGVSLLNLDAANSNGTSLDFSFDSVLGKRIYDGFKADKSLNLVITDQAGNRVETNLSGLPATIAHQKVEAAKNITVTPVGGTLVDNSLNSTNTNLIVDADVNSKLPLNNAELLLNGQVIAKASAAQISGGKIHFDLNTTNNSDLQKLVSSSGFISVRVWDYFGESATSEINRPLSVKYDGNITTNPNTSSGGIGNPVIDNGTVATLTAPDNIRISAIGGSISSNALNASNIDMVVNASIAPGQATGGKAELKIGSKVIAVDTAINATKNELHFDLGTSSSAALQSTINTGGAVSIVLTNAAGQTVSSTNNPWLNVDYTPLAIVTPLSIVAATDGLNAQELASPISVQVDLSNLQSAQNYSIELLKDGASFSTPVIHAITAAEANARSASFNIPAGATWGSDGNKQLSVKLSNIITQASTITATSNVVVDTTAPGAATAVTYVRPAVHGDPWGLEITIPAGQMAGGKAVLNGLVTYVDSTISASDTKVTFTVPDNELSHATFNNGIDFSLFDAAGNLTTGNIYKLPQTYTNQGGTVFNAPTNIKIFPVGGNGITNTINASTSSLRVTADITPGQATGGMATLLLYGDHESIYVFDKQILAGDTSISFDVTTDSPFALKALFGGSSAIHARVTLEDAKHTSVESAEHPVLATAYVNGEAIAGGLTAPTSIKLTAIGGNVTPMQGNTVTLNNTNVGFTVEANIVPGQVALGKAELWIGNKLIGTNDYLQLTDTNVKFYSWSIPESALTPSYLQFALQSGGDLIIKLYDHAGHVVSSTPGSLNVVTNYASGIATPLHDAASNLVSIVGQPVPELYTGDVYFT